MNPEQLIREYVSDTVSFAIATYKHLQKTPDTNFVSSPFSMETLLILLRLGAKGATANEIKTKLRQTNDKAKIEPAVKTLISVLTQGGFYTFSPASKIYVKNGCAIKADFKEITEDIFLAYVENMNFNNPNTAAKYINTWITGQTFGHISDLIKPEKLSNSSRLVLVNTLYVNTMWEMKFTKEITNRRRFFTAEDEFVEAEYVASRGRYRYYDIKNIAKMVEVKFLADEGSMVFILPNTREGLAQIENMTDSIFNIPSSGFTEDNIKIELPEFKISTALDFKEVLQECGVRKVFRASEADLSGIAGGKGDLHVDTIIQKIVIKVDEKGIETSAKDLDEWKNRTPFTAAKEPITEFIVDHPFMFYIKLEDVIIFVGRVVDPTITDYTEAQANV